MLKVSQLIAEIKSAVWPSGVPENLDAPVLEGQPSPLQMIFDEAMADICQWVPEEQTGNVDTYDFCKTNFNGALTVFRKPEGSVIRRVSTIVDGNYNDRVDYVMKDWPEPQIQARSRPLTILSEGTPPQPIGFLPADSSTDWPGGRAFVGIWSIHTRNIYMWPWIHSTEKVVVEWDGKKNAWNPDDLITESRGYRKAVKLYVQYVKCRDYGPKNEAPMYKSEYDVALAEYAYQCREENKLRRTLFVDPANEPQTIGGTGMPCSQNKFSGSLALGVGATGGTVVGLNLGFTPRVAILTVNAPLNGLQMFASMVQGTLTVDGFTFVISGMTDNDQYSVSYEIS